MNQRPQSIEVLVTVQNGYAYHLTTVTVFSAVTVTVACDGQPPVDEAPRAALLLEAGPLPTVTKIVLVDVDSMVVVGEPPAPAAPDKLVKVDVAYMV